jgi:hypothetical protein
MRNIASLDDGEGLHFVAHSQIPVFFRLEKSHDVKSIDDLNHYAKNGSGNDIA